MPRVYYDGTMKWEIDKKGLYSALEIAGAGLVIVISAHFIAREVSFLSASSPQQEIVTEILPEPVDDNAFYVDPSGEKPVFLDEKTLAKKREALIWEKRDFLFVDLDAGLVSFYKKGAPRVEFPIAGSPAAGSFFDIPRGFYTIQGKSENHASK